MADKVVSVRLIARVGQYASEMNQAAQVTSNFAGHLTGQVGKAQQAVTTLGTAAALAGKVTLLGIGAAMVVSAKAAIDFESSLASVAKTTDLSGAALERFGRGIRDLSLEIPINVNELNEIAAIGGQLGITENNLISFTDTIAKLGVTTNLGTQEAAVGLARFVNIMGSSQSDIDTFGSIIVELGNNFETTETEITNFALRLAPIGATVGLTESGVLALGTALSSLGIPAERGSTAVQRLFIDMEKAVQAGGEELEAFAGVARMSADQFATAYRSDPLQALQALVEGLAMIDAEGGNTIEALDQIGVKEQRAIATTLALAQGTEILADSYAAANAQAENATALQEEAALRFGTSASQIQLLGNSFNDLRIELGNAFLDTGLLQSWIDTLRDFLAVARENVDTIKALGAAFGILSTIAVVNFFGGMAVKALSSAKNLFVLLRATEGLSTGMKVLRVTSLGLNAAFGVLGVATVVLGTIWFNQARKAQKLRDAVNELNAAVEAGSDIETAIADRLIGELDPETIRALQDAGFTVRDVAAAMADGTVDVDEYANAMRNVFALGQSEERAGIQGLFGVRDTGLDEARKPIEDVTKAIEELDVVAAAFREGQLDKFVDEFRELNPETELTAEQIRAMGREIQKVQGADLTGWAQNVQTAAMVAQTALDALTFNIGPGAVSGPDVDLSFMEQVFDLEDGAAQYESFTTTILDATQGFRDELVDSFMEMRDQIMDSVPVWEEYDSTVSFVMGSVSDELREETEEQKGIILRSVEDMVAATDEFLADYQAWVEFQPELLATASQGVIDYLDTLSLAEKAGLAEASQEEQDAILANFERMYGDSGEASTLTEEFWQTRLPGIVRDSGEDILAAAQEAADKITEDNPGIDAGEAMAEGIVIAIEDFSDDPTLQTLLMELLLDPTLLGELLGAGRTEGQQIVNGILEALRSGEIDSELYRMQQRFGAAASAAASSAASAASAVTRPTGGTGGVQPKSLNPGVSGIPFVPTSSPTSTSSSAAAITYGRSYSIQMGDVYNPTTPDLLEAVNKSALKLQRTIRYAESAR